ncbi:adenylosuccinate lyase [Gynuella sunshinyii]|uniref:Adenylosuccinate lyase n=2 Tax=Gynuella sunshinyii TaxID=1445505 RepID=A0A0C5VFV5_9GAMM|nr:adenylosuccinate lyase [Gynuella sunshinyii]AII80613.1 adenylosuccinate lyase [Gynuella sunshinyii YC6258]AJQ93081.1 adenylosuccinate lyase [Gynuella sunshinyii YC6258]
MNINPIDEGRYGSLEMRRLFSKKFKYQTYIEIEKELVIALFEAGEIARHDVDIIIQKAEHYDPDLKAISDIESSTRHEVAAVIKHFSSLCGEAGKYVHFGATSSDILDTTTAIQLKKASTLLERLLTELCELACNHAFEHQDLIMIGRTHGQQALPITLGFKFANWADELSRHLIRFRQIKSRLFVGKLAGAVGASAAIETDDISIESRVMQRLGITAGNISTQIVHRDRIAEFICFSALLASSLDNIATEIRNLQRTEIDELREPFGLAHQIGSSTMPHKRNPVLCENICSLARLLRGMVIPAMENMVSWHERDLANSANERFIIPQACLLLEEILQKAVTIFKDISINRDSIERNLREFGQKYMAEAVMLELIKHGVDRQVAYHELRSLSHLQDSDEFEMLVKNNLLITNTLSISIIEELLKPKNYIGHCAEKAILVAQNVLNEIKNG